MLCRHRSPSPTTETVIPVLPVLRKLLAECQDAEVIIEAAWAVAYLCDGRQSCLSRLL